MHNRLTADVDTPVAQYSRLVQSVWVVHGVAAVADRTARSTAPVKLQECARVVGMPEVSIRYRVEASATSHACIPVCGQVVTTNAANQHLPPDQQKACLHNAPCMPDARMTMTMMIKRERE